MSPKEHKDIRKEITLVGTKSLLEDMQILEDRKQTAIWDLLSEWKALEESTPVRIKAIQSELRALGWTRPRVKVDKDGAKT